MAANVISLVFTVVFARLLGATGYGSLAALVSAFLILSVPGQALQVTVARDVSHAAAGGDRDPAGSVWRWLATLLLAGAGLTLLSILLREEIAALIGVDDLPWAAAAVLPAGVAWLILSVLRGALQGLQRYRLVGISIICEAAARLVVGLILVGAGLDETGAFLGTGLSVAVTAAALAAPLHRAAGRAAEHEFHPLRDLLAGAWAPVLALALIAVLQNIDVIVVKHSASGEAAGSYAAAAVAAKVMIWVAIGLGLYLLPEAARRTKQGVDARPVLARTLALIALGALPLILVYAVAAEPLLRAVYGDDLTGAAGALPLLAIAMTLLSCSYLAVQYLLAVERAWFLGVLALAAVAEPIVLLSIGADLTAVAGGILVIQLAVALAVIAVAFRTAHHPETRRPGSPATERVR